MALSTVICKFFFSWENIIWWLVFVYSCLFFFFFFYVSLKCRQRLTTLSKPVTHFHGCAVPSRNKTCAIPLWKKTVSIVGREQGINCTFRIYIFFFFRLLKYSVLEGEIIATSVKCIFESVCICGSSACWYIFWTLKYSQCEHYHKHKANIAWLRTIFNLSKLI